MATQCNNHSREEDVRVVFLSRLFHPHIGGVEKHVEKLSIELVKKGYQVTVITTQYESSLDLDDTYKGIHLLRIPRDQAKRKKSLWKWMESHKKEFKDADVVHVHDVFWWYLLLRFTVKTPVYTTFHGWEGKFPPPLKSKVIRKISEKLSLGSICIGDYIKKWYWANPNIVLYGATDQKPLPSASKNRLLVLGRLSKDNDIPSVIRGIRLIKTYLPDLRVTFLGDGELAWQAKEQGDVLGFKEDIEPYIKDTHWVIASSYLSIMDSLSAGRTVFSVYTNPLKEDYLKLHPVSQGIYTTSSSQELAQTFVKVYDQSQEHSQMVNRAQQWAREQTWEVIADHYIKLWNDKSYTFAYKKLSTDLNFK